MELNNNTITIQPDSITRLPMDRFKSIVCDRAGSPLKWTCYWKIVGNAPNSGRKVGYERNSLSDVIGW